MTANRWSGYSSTFDRCGIVDHVFERQAVEAEHLAELFDQRRRRRARSASIHITGYLPRSSRICARSSSCACRRSARARSRHSQQRRLGVGRNDDRSRPRVGVERVIEAATLLTATAAVLAFSRQLAGDAAVSGALAAWRSSAVESSLPTDPRPLRVTILAASAPADRCSSRRVRCAAVSSSSVHPLPHGAA